jgi:hypothetical protein
MANAVRGEVPLKLEDGREFTLVLDFDALVEAEGAYGKPLAQMMGDLSGGFVGSIRAVLWGAMRAKHPDIALRDVSAMVLSNGEAIGTALTAAVEAAFPDASAEGKAPAAKAQRGKASGASGAKRG